MPARDALALYTTGGAFAMHRETEIGSLEPGKLADFVVLSDDLFTVAQYKIKDLEVVRTVVGGKTMYQA